MAERPPMTQDDNAAQSAVGRLRSASVSAATKVINLNPQLDLRKPAIGGDNIIFDENGHSARAANATELQKQAQIPKSPINRRFHTSTPKRRYHGQQP
ncbi:hypothetical protein KCU94_g22957, partial [Aureobasidium melanogenum]